MYGLNKNEDLSLIKGATLLQACFGENEVILNFDCSVVITILSEYQVSSGAGFSRFNESRAGAPSLLSLIGMDVDIAHATDDGGLFLKFSNGQSLEVFDTSCSFESIWLKIGEREIVV